MGNLWITFLC